MSDFLQVTVQGIAAGSKYALVALGFVVIFKATGVINFAQGGFVLFGAYLAYNVGTTWGLPFVFAVVLAMVGGAIIGATVERVALRPMIGQPPFAAIMITIGVLFVLEQIVTSIWGFDTLNLGDPWGNDRIAAGDVTIAVRNLWSVGLAGAALLAFFLFFRYSNTGVAMRATALDPEAALAQGISPGRVYTLAWAVSGAVAALAGVTLASGSGQLSPGIGYVALAAFPAIILGGLDSPAGAVLGGLLIGVSQALTARYLADWSWLGTNFHTVMPYVLMVLILLVRPYGLFGTREVQRV
ncbi:MAG: livH [Acidimicrobiales bacterium]|jgi:branched-chain amino acid transport system permease protein|nr:livH [Acidimicrobiales bacterium]